MTTSAKVEASASNVLSSDLSSKILSSVSTLEQTAPSLTGCIISILAKVKVPAVYEAASAEASNSTSLPPEKSLNKIFDKFPVAAFLKSAISPLTPKALHALVAPRTVAFLSVKLPAADPSGPSTSKP